MPSLPQTHDTTTAPPTGARPDLIQIQKVSVAYASLPVEVSEARQRKARSDDLMALMVSLHGSIDEDVDLEF